jgi:hypothetical protein
MLLAMVLIGVSSSLGQAVSASDWKAVEEAMGRPGQMQPGDVIKFGMPRNVSHVARRMINLSNRK